MGIRHIYLARHGSADAFGELTGIGRRQTHLLGERLAAIPVDAIWHSPLPRTVATAHELARYLPAAHVDEAPELIDHIPYVPTPAETLQPWIDFFDGYDSAEAASGHQVVITHANQIAWLVRDALDAPLPRG